MFPICSWCLKLYLASSRWPNLGRLGDEVYGGTLWSLQGDFESSNTSAISCLLSASWLRWRGEWKEGGEGGRGRGVGGGGKCMLSAAALTTPVTRLPCCDDGGLVPL